MSEHLFWKKKKKKGVFLKSHNLKSNTKSSVLPNKRSHRPYNEVRQTEKKVQSHLRITFYDSCNPWLTPVQFCISKKEKPSQ